MGRVINPNELVASARTIISESTIKTTKMYEMLAPIAEIENEDSLTGNAWTSVKGQLSAYRTVIQGGLLAYNSMQTDALTLIGVASIATEVLDEDRINELLNTTIEAIEGESSRIESMIELNGKEIDGYTYDYTKMIKAANETLSGWESQQTMLENKLEKLEQIDSGSSSLFVSAKNEWRVFATGVEEIAGSWQNGSFTPCSGSWMMDINDKWEQERAQIILRNEGITEEQIKHMGSLGYSKDDIANILEGCYTAEDKIFVKNIMKGTEEGYRKAFEVDPDKITGIPCLFMAGYANLLLVKDTKQLELFNNAMYESEKIFVWDPITGEVTHRTYLDGHMENMVAGTRAQMEGLTQYLAAMLDSGMGPGDAAYDQALSEHQSMYASLLLWEPQLTMLYETTRVEMNRLYHAMSVSDIQYDATTGGVSYTLHQLNQDEKYITGDKLTDIAEANSREKVRGLEKRLEELNRKHFGGVVTTVGLAALATVAPAAALFTAAALSALEGTSNISTNLSETVKTKAAGISIGAIEGIVNASINIQLEGNRLRQAINKENERSMWARFGVLGEVETGDDKYLLGGGFYDPDRYRVLSRYQNGIVDIDGQTVKGLAAMDGWNADKSKVMKGIIGAVEDDNFTDEERKVCQQIIDGSFDITDVSTYHDFTNALEEMKTMKDIAGKSEEVETLRKAAELFD